MSDFRAVLRIIDEFLWALRREGFDLSTAQAIDVARAVRLVGVGHGDAVREAIAAIVVERADRRVAYDAAFDAFFQRSGTPAPDLWGKLATSGLRDDEIDALRAILQSPGLYGEGRTESLIASDVELDRALVLSGIVGRIDADSGDRLGYLSHRAVVRIGVHRSQQWFDMLRSLLLPTFGARADRIADVLAQHLDDQQESVRLYVQRAFERKLADRDRVRRDRKPDTTPFHALSETEIEAVRRTIRSFADRLRGGARVHERRAARGRIDPHATLRHCMKTGGVPFQPVRARRKRRRPKLVLLCDISDSVRPAAVFLLEFTYFAHELFERVTSFVFVSQLGETTTLFEREPVRTAIARAWSGHVVPTGDNSNYGRVLQSFAKTRLRLLDRQTTVVILGDGRTNYHDPAAEVLDRIRERVRGLIWLCPEPTGKWGQGDSAMRQYAPKCSQVYTVTCAKEMKRAASALVARGSHGFE